MTKSIKEEVFSIKNTAPIDTAAMTVPAIKISFR